MDDEPTGSRLDDTRWEEPRPPHLPDRLASITPWVLPFLIVVAYQVWLLWVDRPRGGDITMSLPYWLEARFRFAGIAGSLIGLALFIRHPDPARRFRTSHPARSCCCCSRS